MPIRPLSGDTFAAVALAARLLSGGGVLVLEVGPVEEGWPKALADGARDGARAKSTLLLSGGDSQDGSEL